MEPLMLLTLAIAFLCHYLKIDTIFAPLILIAILVLPIILWKVYEFIKHPRDTDEMK